RHAVLAVPAPAARAGARALRPVHSGAVRGRVPVERVLVDLQCRRQLRAAVAAGPGHRDRLRRVPGRAGARFRAARAAVPQAPLTNGRPRPPLRPHWPEATRREQAMAQDEGITLIDTGYLRPRLCAAWLVHGGDGRAALVDCGTAATAGRVLEAIDAAGVARDAIDWLLVTHVHLDHAGGAGPLMRALPNARPVVHPRGAGGGGRGRARGRTARPPAALQRHPRPRAASLQRLGPCLALLDRGRCVRAVLPRTRYRARPAGDPHHLAGAVRSGADAGVDP